MFHTIESQQKEIHLQVFIPQIEGGYLYHIHGIKSS